MAEEQQRRGSFTFFRKHSSEEGQGAPKKRPSELDFEEAEAIEKPRMTSNLLSGGTSPRKNRKAKERSVEISNHRLRTGDIVFFSFAQQAGFHLREICWCIDNR